MSKYNTGSSFRVQEFFSKGKAPLKPGLVSTHWPPESRTRPLSLCLFGLYLDSKSICSGGKQVLHPKMCFPSSPVPPPPARVCGQVAPWGNPTPQHVENRHRLFCASDRLHLGFTSSGLDAWYTRQESSYCFSASAWSVTPLDSYTGVTLWHSAMAFTASCTRLLMVRRTLVVSVGPF